MDDTPRLPIRKIRMDLHGLRGVVFGVVNKNSIAWNVVVYLRECGAEVVLVCRRERTVQRLKTWGAEIGIKHVYHCDVERADEVDACFALLATHVSFDFMLHAIASSDPAQLQGRYTDMTRENFIHTMVVSADSFRDLTKRMEPFMPNGGGIVTLSFAGAEFPFPNYNGMGVAKAALEASVRGTAFDLGEHNIWINALRTSPKQTLSAKGIGNNELIGQVAQAMSMREGRATREQIAQAVAFYLTVDAGITGEVVNIDNGASACGMFHPRHAALMRSAAENIDTVHKGGGVEFPRDFFSWDE